MKTNDLFNQYNDLMSSKEDLKNREKSIEISEHNLKVLLKEKFSTEIVSLFNIFVEYGENPKRCLQIILDLENELSAKGEVIPEIILKHFPEEKEKLLRETKNPGFLTDKSYFQEVLKFGKSILSKNAFDRVLNNIGWSTEDKVVKGSKPEFIVLLNDFDKNNGVECKTLTASQLWNNNYLFKDRFWVDSGLYLNGVGINSETAEHFIKQFEKLGWAKNGVLEFPIKIDLYKLTFNGNKEGLIYLTEESIYAQTKSFQNGVYPFEKTDIFRIPLKSDYKTIDYVPSAKGLFRCWFGRDLDLDAWIECLSDSYPYGRVIRELA